MESGDDLSSQNTGLVASCRAALLVVLNPLTGALPALILAALTLACIGIGRASFNIQNGIQTYVLRVQNANCVVQSVEIFVGAGIPGYGASQADLHRVRERNFVAACRCLSLPVRI